MKTNLETYSINVLKNIYIFYSIVHETNLRQFTSIAPQALEIKNAKCIEIPASGCHNYFFYTVRGVKQKKKFVLCKGSIYQVRPLCEGGFRRARRRLKKQISAEVFFSLQ